MAKSAEALVIPVAAGAAGAGILWGSYSLWKWLKNIDPSSWGEDFIDAINPFPEFDKQVLGGQDPDKPPPGPGPFTKFWRFLNGKDPETGEPIPGTMGSKI